MFFSSGKTYFSFFLHCISLTKYIVHSTLFFKKICQTCSFTAIIYESWGRHLGSRYFLHWHFDKKSWFAMIFFTSEMGEKVHKSTFRVKNFTVVFYTDVRENKSFSTSCRKRNYLGNYIFFVGVKCVLNVICMYTG